MIQFGAGRTNLGSSCHQQLARNKKAAIQRMTASIKD
jgi:hypothetical protein